MSDAANGPGPEVLKLLDQLSRLKAEDLAAVDERVKAKRDEPKGLLTLRGLIAAKLGVAKKAAGTRTARKPGESPSSASAGGELTHTRRVRVARLLAARGILSSGAIMADAEIGPTKITETLSCEWFEKTPQGYRLTALGRKEALGG